jgi:AICAR transformylase/IMP cyclohydrolase PurH
LIVGTELGPPLVMVKFTGLEVPTPGAGLVTVTASMPVEAMAAAGMAAVNCVELTNVVVGAAPPKLTSEPATKFVPLIVIVKASPSATALFGEIVVIAGLGFGSVSRVSCRSRAATAAAARHEQANAK